MKTKILKSKAGPTSVALVTGGSTGIGKAVAERLARDGNFVYVNHLRDPRGAHALVNAIRATGGRALAIKADVSREGEVKAMFARVAREQGRLDILVNSAGVETFSPFLKMKTTDWNRVLNTNLGGTFLCSRAAANMMAKRKSGGSIVNISSVHERIPWGGYSHYCASKAGVSMLTKTMALELAQKNIRVNNVSPGAIDTPINKSWEKNIKLKKIVLEKIPAGRLGSADEVAGSVAYLVSNEARYVTGTSLFIDGGMLLYASFMEQG
jgi:glucose 1-dehydrogenase